MISPDFQYFLGTSSPYQVIGQRVACPWSVPWTSCARSFDLPTAARPMTPIHIFACAILRARTEILTSGESVVGLTRGYKLSESTVPKLKVRSGVKNLCRCPRNLSTTRCPVWEAAILLAELRRLLVLLIDDLQVTARDFGMYSGTPRSL